MQEILGEETVAEPLGRWGYGPLVVSLSNTQEVLYVVNRPASRPSHEGAALWLMEWETTP